jgi:hypothetical protein
MTQIKKRAFNLSLTLAVIYVGLATLTVFSVYPSSIWYGDWVWISLVITFPVSILSFGVMYADANALYIVSIIQFIVFLIFWYFSYRYLLRK